MIDSQSSNILPFPKTSRPATRFRKLLRAEVEAAGVSVEAGSRVRVLVPAEAFRRLFEPRMNSHEWHDRLVTILRTLGIDTKLAWTSHRSDDNSMIYAGVPLATAELPRPNWSGPVWGLMGKAGAGKDTFFRALQKVGVNCARFALGDPLKQEVAAALGVPVAQIEEDKPRFRPLLQWWGTEWRRAQSGNYWIDRTAENIRALPEDWKGVAVITDVRFLNEAAFVRGQLGSVIRIVRESHDGLDGSAGGHASEVEADSIPADWTVHNHVKGFSNLCEQADELARLLRAPRLAA